MSDTVPLSLVGPTGMDAGLLFSVVRTSDDIVDDGFVVVVLPADDV